ncbi:hypothetical protein BTJ68_07911 [Hortaea werneckii EXF-2000]|uniref:Uncharacterized protein n=1 Tax=Hortaea werneckii EXF-2000 TaxID=1157616 RepID=A0A1Z5T9D3_HORWE|nr:hypothetical protein BTJ68_07911 [Hortaea werneckii EXF-2000]
MTPARGSGGEWDKRLQDSPFSDYFTDDARSVDTSAGKSSRYSGAGAWLSEEGQDLLARLGRLQTRVMRAEEGEQEWVRRVVERKVREVERELEDWDRRPGSAELEDSGFIDEEGRRREGLLREVDSESDLQLSEARQILENVTKAQEELRQRHTELRLLTDQHLEQLENNETEIETLRSENEGLRSDLGFDHSELLFLKLQMKAIEVEVEDLDKPASQSQKLANHSQHGEKNVRRGQILQEMDQWRNDWQDVNGRLKRRLSRYGVLSADKRDHSLEKELQVRAEDLGDWQLETIRERSGGKVASLTIRRVKHGEPVADGVVEIQARMGKAEEEEEGQMPTHAEQKSSPPAGASEKGCQTEDQHNTNYVEQGSQTDRIPPVPTIDQVIQTEALNHSDISTSTDLSTSLSSSNPVQSYHDEATQTDVSLASLLPPRYYAPDAYGIEQSGEAVTELVLVDGEKEEMDDEEEDEDDEEEEEEDEADPAISTFPSSPTNTHDINDDNDEASSPPTHPSASFEEEIASSSLKQQQQQQQQQQRRKYKSAWAELWEGLGHLAGVGGDEDDEEGEEEEEGY